MRTKPAPTKTHPEAFIVEVALVAEDGTETTREARVLSPSDFNAGVVLRLRVELFHHVYGGGR